MDSIKNNYFTTGEFAKLCDITKQTLFHYDDIGLFSPEAIGENGYRYYSYQQLEIFAIISILKEMDMPLKEIKEYLDNRAPEALIQLLNQKQREVDAKIRNLQYMKNYLEQKKKITVEGLNAKTEEITYLELAEEYLIITGYDGKPDDRDIAAAITKHYNYCRSLGISLVHSIGSTVRISDIPNGDIYSYSQIYTQAPGKEYPGLCIKPAGTYAVIYHANGYDTAYQSYHSLLEDVLRRGYTPGEYFYEDTLLDELSMDGYDNYMIKISVHCTR